MPAARDRIIYVTSSDYKREENRVFAENTLLADGTRVNDLFEFDLRKLSIRETLEIRITEMVRAEVISAYSQLRVPCIVEHAGLIFGPYMDLGEGNQYPGGLTKPMWDALGDRFLEETQSGGRPACARAVVGYCDGQSVKLFDGETRGTMAEHPRGKREFYWDTVFVPDDPTEQAGSKTYAEIVEDAALGLEYKVENLSQSTKAMRKLLEYLRGAGPPPLWPEGV